MPAPSCPQRRRCPGVGRSPVRRRSALGAPRWPVAPGRAGQRGPRARIPALPSRGEVSREEARRARAAPARSRTREDRGGAGRDPWRAFDACVACIVRSPAMARIVRSEAHGITDVGRRRYHNEDHFGSFPEEGLYIVADGMGGMSDGHRAAQLAVEVVREFFRETAADPDRPWPFKMERTRSYEENRLATGVRAANRRIFEDAQNNVAWRGMGSTIVAASVTGDHVQIAHVGDSRVYRLRGGEIESLTRD